MPLARNGPESSLAVDRFEDEPAAGIAVTEAQPGFVALTPVARVARGEAPLAQLAPLRRRGDDLPDLPFESVAVDIIAMRHAVILCSNGATWRIAANV